MTTYPMSPVDAAWYHMDGPANLAMVTGIMLTRSASTSSAVKAVYRRRLGRVRSIPPARRRARLPDRDAPLGGHAELRHRPARPPHRAAGAARPGGAHRAARRSSRARRSTTNSRSGRSTSSTTSTGGSALIMRYHHCIGDGTAMMAVIEQLSDDDARRAAGTAGAPKPRRPRTRPAPAGLGAGPRCGRAAAGEGRSPLAGRRSTPSRIRKRVIDKAALVLEGAGMLVGELLKRAGSAIAAQGRLRPAQARRLVGAGRRSRTSRRSARPPARRSTTCSSPA